MIDQKDQKVKIETWETEKHLYIMPDDAEAFLAALAALQDYWKWTAKRFTRVDIHIYFKNKLLKFLLPAFSADTVTSVTVVDDLFNRDYDHVVEFDGKVAYEMGKVTEKHITQVFGIIVGSEPQKSTPDITACLKSNLTHIDILIFPFPAAKQLFEFLMNNHPELQTTFVGTSTPDWQDAVGAKLVVGLRSGMTYLAAAAGRGVLEIYPTDVHRNWLSKWSHPLYQMIYANPEQVSATLAYRSVEILWKKVKAFELAKTAKPIPLEIEKAANAQ